MTNELITNPNPWVYHGRGLSERLIKITTISSLLNTTYQSTEAASRPALTWYIDGERVSHWSYAELILEVWRIAAELQFSHRVRKGNHVVVISSNCPEVYFTYLAILAIGAVAVPVSNFESPRTLRFIVDQVEPMLIIEGIGVSPTLLQDLKLPVRNAASLLAAAQQRAPMLLSNESVSPDDLGVIVFTSGTTSIPKGVCLSHYNLLINAEGLKRAHALDHNRHHLCILPLFHVNAFGFSMVSSIYSGCHVVLCNRFFGQELWTIARKERVNILSAVPEVIRMLGTRRISPHSIPDMKYVVSAAAPLSKKTAVAFEANTGIPIHQGYGLSECTNFAATTPSTVGATTRMRLISEWQVPSIGPALFGTEIRIAKHDGMFAREGEEGEVLIAGHNVMLGYWQSPEETAVAFRHGWLHTGDLGFFIELDGIPQFFITGRIKEIILRHGENIAPRAVEEELAGLAEVGRFAVCGFRNEAAGEEVGVYIQAPFSEHTLAVVHAALEQCPIRYRPQVVLVGDAAIPTTVTGKVQRKLLGKQFAKFEPVLFGGKPYIKPVEPDEPP